MNSAIYYRQFFYPGDREVGRDSGKIKFDAKSTTRDPDAASGDLNCVWKCTDKVLDQPCYSFANKQTKIYFANRCVVEIDSIHFEAGKSYVIT